MRKGQRHEERVDFVPAVRPHARDAQIQVDLAAGLHYVHKNVRQGLGSVRIFLYVHSGLSIETGEARFVNTSDALPVSAVWM
jgi:hypothetical protein